MDIRNAQETESGTTDLEILHGGAWVPYTLADDGTALASALSYVLADKVARGDITVAPYVPPTPPTPEEVLATERAGMRVTRFQLKAQIASDGNTAAAEAAIGEASATVQVAFAEAEIFSRSSDTVQAIAAGLALTEEDLDAFMRNAAALRP